MTSRSSESGRIHAGRSNNVRAPRSGLERRTVERPPLDDIDHILLEELSIDARIPNNALAAKAGIAPSTCLTRIRALRERGVIRGFHADIDPALAGRPLQAMVAVRIQPNARSRLDPFLWDLSELPGVLNAFLLGGTYDFFVHVAAPDSTALNAFVVEHLSSNPDVALTETSLIFQHARSPRFA
ncbi:Lrp/AsnC family transcriptional regulator [Nocardioides luteus]|uniref:Lrp/AsnC family transcriptional regulator n=1 Tax=Nocardioides luteus TaxID=1844 RepID=UPI0018CB9D30|nr:Lrp/AsnC family transcriptional regulator [Nocardioides luteus]MBG6096009.1 DNA-binding Lrp family transcriptional regulator [Nocardioides luteus]